jgi:hypothetical protein
MRVHPKHSPSTHPCLVPWCTLHTRGQRQMKEQLRSSLPELRVAPGTPRETSGESPRAHIPPPPAPPPPPPTPPTPVCVWGGGMGGQSSSVRKHCVAKLLQKPRESETRCVSSSRSVPVLGWAASRPAGDSDDETLKSQTAKACVRPESPEVYLLVLSETYLRIVM